MHRTVRLATILVLGMALVLSACGSAATTGRQQAVDDPSAVASEWGLQGDANETTEPFDMPAGETEFSYSHKGAGTYAVALLDANNNQVEQIASGTGETSASKKVDVQTAGKYRLKITAASPWEITVHYPGDSPTSQR